MSGETLYGLFNYCLLTYWLGCLCFVAWRCARIDAIEQSKDYVGGTAQSHCEWFRDNYGTDQFREQELRRRILFGILSPISVPIWLLYLLYLGTRWMLAGLPVMPKKKQPLDIDQVINDTRQFVGLEPRRK